MRRGARVAGGVVRILDLRTTPAASQPPLLIKEGKKAHAFFISPPHMRRGGGRRPPGWSINHKLACNDFQNSFEILDDFTIFESHHPHSSPFQKQRAVRIAVLRSFVIVSCAV